MGAAPPSPPARGGGSSTLPAHVEWGHSITPADVTTLLGTDAAAGLRSLVIRDGRGLDARGWAALASAADLAVLHVTRLPPRLAGGGGWAPRRLVRLEVEAAMWDVDDLAAFFGSLLGGNAPPAVGTADAAAAAAAAGPEGTRAMGGGDGVGDGGVGGGVGGSGGGGSGSGGGGGGGGGGRGGSGGHPVGLVELVWEHGSPLRTAGAEAVLAAGMAGLAATLRRVTIRRCAGFTPTHPALMAVLAAHPQLSLVTDGRTR